jgi:hypothetical protein
MLLVQYGSLETSKNEDGIVMRNKAILVAQGFTQVKGLNFGETFAPVARLEAIRILLAYACSHNIKLYQMDVKSTFLNGRISELVHMEQHPVLRLQRSLIIFINSQKLSMVLSKLPRLGMRD